MNNTNSFIFASRNLIVAILFAILTLLIGLMSFYEGSNRVAISEGLGETSAKVSLDTMAVACGVGAGNVSGTVFRDYDADGVHDALELGVSGITITAYTCLLYTSPSPRDQRGSRMPSSA